ncbi:MFS transporter small subunit [Fulvimarina manganoxydans]|nr:hypothetical protein [Fulvimarina manganoxydans]
MAQNETTTTTSSTKLYLAWAFVGIPLAWGVVMTLIKAMDLFAG